MQGMDSQTTTSTSAQSAELTIFYDGYCPLCVAEMQQLRRLDDRRPGPPRLLLEDIHSAGFAQRYPHIDPQAADRILHGQLADGRMLMGLDVTCRAWQLVERKPWLKLLRWPLLRWFADQAYFLFARNRYGISWLLTGQRRCQSCQLTEGNRCASTRQGESGQ
jgi:predicted DCC family thiol-disulfide oxidoreductase YuxK